MDWPIDWTRMISCGPIDSPIIITNANYATVAWGMINTRYDELYSYYFPRQHCRDFNSNNFVRNNETSEHGDSFSPRVEIASHRDLLQLRRAAPLYLFGKIHSVIREWREMHAYEWKRSYNCTHVVLSKGRRDWPVAGFPFVRDADRLCRFLLYRFRLVEQRQLVKLLDICNSPKKKEKTYYHLPRSSRRSEVKSSRIVWPLVVSQTARDFISFLSAFSACKRHDKLTRNLIQSVRSHRMHRTNVKMI